MTNFTSLKRSLLTFSDSWSCCLPILRDNRHRFYTGRSTDNLKKGPIRAKIQDEIDATHPAGGGGLLPYMGYIGVCGSKGYGFLAVLVKNRVSILAGFGHFSHKWDMVFVLYQT